MKWFLLGLGLLLAGCESTESMTGQMYVRPAEAAPTGCRLVGTIRDTEGGGLHSYEHNRTLVEERLRTQAARIGGDALAVVEEKRGDPDDGYQNFPTGAAGLTTPASRCTNCVALAAHVFQCGAHPPPAVRPTAPQRDDCVPTAPPEGQPAPDDDDWNACLRRHGLQRTGSR